MADQNEIRLSGTMTGVVVLDETINGIDYTANVVDRNIESVGGQVNWSGNNGYQQNHACKWTDVAIDGATMQALDHSNWNIGSVSPSGVGIPTKVRAMAIKYESKVGTITDKPSITIKDASNNAITLCCLDVGEGVAIPLNGATGSGINADKIFIQQTSADANNHAKVTIALLGWAG